MLNLCFGINAQTKMEETSKVVRSSEVVVKVGLDENNIPVRMDWMAESSGGFTECKGMLLSIFDFDTKDTLKIDLWTTEMQVEEMDRFMFQTLRGLADTYHKATQNHELASAMQQFVEYFGQKTEILTAEK